MLNISVFVGRDPENARGAVCATYYDGDPAWDDTRGWTPRPGTLPDDVSGWRRYARNCRCVKLPEAVSRAGLSWDDADASPSGWSGGPGHAPEGVEFVWEVK